MKKYRKIIIIVLILLVAGFAVARAFQKPKGPSYLTAKVERKDLVQTVDATGSISSADDIDLNFKTTGRIASVRVRIGDRVTQGQVLADLAAAGLSSEVTRAQAAVRSAEADLEKLISGTTPESLAVTKEEISNASIQLEAAKTKLQNISRTNEKTREQYRSTALQTLADKSFVAQFALDVVYDDLLDQEATDLFKTTNTFARDAARTSYALAKANLASVATSIATAQNSQNDADILQALNALQGALARTSECLDSALEAFSGGIVTSSYSSTALATLKANSSAQSTAVATAKTTVQTSVTNLTIGLQDLQKTYDDAEFAVKAAEGSLALAQARLKLAEAKPQSYEIKQQQSRVAQAQASLQLALSNLSDTVITAPIAGVITAVDIKVGEQANLSKPAITMIGDSKLEIEVDIPESDITKVALTDPVSLTLDAFGPEKTFSGTVQFIEPAERPIEGVIYYRVTIGFDNPSDQVKPGMTANITITTETKAQVLVVPARAVVATEDGVKKVKVMTAQTAMTEEREVVTGLKGDGGLIEIISGLTEGETVVTGEQKR